MGSAEARAVSLPARIAAVLFMVALYYAIQFPSTWAGLQNPWGAPESWVENGAWLYMSVHHVAQLLLALGAIILLSRGRPAEWGLNIRNLGDSLRLVRQFCIWFGLFIAIGFGIQWASGATSTFDRPLSADHVAGSLFFMWIVSGISEEILFRGLMQTYLARFFQGTRRVFDIEIPVSGIVTAIIFSLVHINFSFRSLEITHLSVPQLAIAFVLGIFYAVAYHRTRSLLAPALAHNISNGLMLTSSLALAALH